MRKKRNVTRKKKAKGFWIAAVVPRVALRRFSQLHPLRPPEYAGGSVGPPRVRAKKKAAQYRRPAVPPCGYTAEPM